MVMFYGSLFHVARVSIRSSNSISSSEICTTYFMMTLDLVGFGGRKRMKFRLAKVIEEIELRLRE